MASTADTLNRIVAEIGAVAALGVEVGVGDRRRQHFSRRRWRLDRHGSRHGRLHGHARHCNQCHGAVPIAMRQAGINARVQLR